MDIIDIHTHAISPDTVRFPLSPIGGKQSDWSRTRPVSAEQLLAAMDEAGVAKVALVHASTAYGHDPSYLVECVQRYPARFAGVFSLDMLADDAVPQFDRWTAADLSGLRLFTTGSTRPGQAGWLPDPKKFSVWGRGQSMGIGVCV